MVHTSRTRIKCCRSCWYNKLLEVLPRCMPDQSGNIDAEEVQAQVCKRAKPKGVCNTHKLQLKVVGLPGVWPSLLLQSSPAERFGLLLS